MTATALGLLPRAGAFVSDVIRREEEQLLEHRFILSEVHHVLDEMVYDVETHAHECEVAQLRHELQLAQSTITEYQQRESVLIQERQHAFEYAANVELEAKATMRRVDEQIAIIVAEITKKDALEKELALAREQLHLSAQLSKELANAQREIRELHRKNSIQRLLKTSASGFSAKPPSNSGTRALKFDRAASTNAIVSSPRVIQQSVPVSNQLEVEDNDPFARCSDKILMNVFAHLDANSVFVVSLTSRTLMVRVHTLFGMPPNSIMIKRAKSPDPTAQVPPQPPASTLKQGVLKARSQSTASFNGEKGRTQLAKAEQIVKSLKKDEIKLFHDMSTRVRTLENHLSQTQTEKEDIAARLHSAESVRDFLMDKLKELEDRLSTMMEVTAKKDEQNAMDREIIGFLDSRIHEYEMTVKRITTQNDEVMRELLQVRKDHESKLTIVQDMVSLLTDEKKDLDSQLKAQRKVLVREVKALRVQNQQLAHDKERYFTQLKQLRHALQHLDDLS